MENRNEFVKGLLTGDGWDDADTGAFQYYNVIFLRDFGPFKKDETAECVCIHYLLQCLDSYDKEGNVIKTCEFELQAKG